MSREIKFRLWKVMNKEMIDWKQIKHNSSSNLSYGFWDLLIRPDIAIPMQYTGLKDKNDKEIYEGDILDFGYPATSKYDPDDDTFRLPIIVVVDFHGGAFWFTGEGYTDCNWHFYNAEDREVIGNIYEHEYLLKQK